MNDTSPTAETINSFCAATCMSRSLAYKLIRQGKLRVVKLGTKTVVPLSERARLLAPPPAHNTADAPAS